MMLKFCAKNDIRLTSFINVGPMYVTQSCQFSTLFSVNNSEGLF